MSLMSLTAPTMLTVSAPWIDPKMYRTVLEGYPELASHLIMIERARRQLIDTQVDDGEVSGKIDKKTVEIADHDALHDRKARAIHLIMTGLAARADDPREHDAWLARRDTLFPDALSINSASFTDQAGNVEQVRARISPKLREVFDKTVVDGETLSETIDAWLGAGDALGVALTERALLKRSKDKMRVSAADVRKARFFWVRVVDSFVKFLDMVDMDDQTKAQVLSTLGEALEATQSGDQSTEEEPQGGSPAGEDEVEGDEADEDDVDEDEVDGDEVIEEPV